MYLPKVKFINVKTVTEVDWLHGFLFQNSWGWGKYIFRKHPKLKEVLLFKTEEQQVIFLRRYVLDFRIQKKEQIDRQKLIYEKNWSRVEEEFLTLLSEVIGISWPKKINTITAEISLNPICPRFLDKQSFFLFYNYNNKDALEVMMHEICHFLYFEKWKKVFPKSQPKTFESPYLEWHLSEIIAPIILNDIRVQKLLKQKAVFYPEHTKIRIDRKSAPVHFLNLYKQSMKRGDFEAFLKLAYKEIKVHRKLFNF